MNIARYFKKLPCLGLDISADGLRLLELRKRAEVFYLEKILYQPLATQLVEKKENRWQEIQVELNKLVIQQKLKHYPVALALPEASFLYKKIQLPAYIPPEKWLEDIKQRLIEFFPGIQQKELLFDFVWEHTRNQMHEFLLIVLRKTVLQPYLNLAKAAQLTVKIVDIDLYARARAALACFARHPIPQILPAMVHWEPPVCTLWIFQQQRLVFHLSWQTQQVDESFFKQLREALQAGATQVAVERIELLGLLAADQERLAIATAIENNLAIKTVSLSLFSDAPWSAHTPSSASFLQAYGLAMRGVS